MWSFTLTDRPFTIDHFEEWASGLTLDSGESWRLEPFQREFVKDIFSGTRECWLIVPEGNGKTTLLAGLGLYSLRFGKEPLIPLAASTMAQAKILYKQARGFIVRGHMDQPKDGLWFEAFDGWRRIDVRRETPKTKRGVTIGSMEVHGADSGTGDGVIPYPYAFLDELHRHKDLSLYETWRGKLGKRDAQLIAISTAGAPGSEFEETRKAIRDSGTRKRKGKTFSRVSSPGLVLHEWAVPEDGNTDDLELVAKANPFSGVTVDTLREKKATPTLTPAHWKRFTCNIAALTEGDVFIDPLEWKACEAEFEIPPGAVVAIGADGSRTWDTTVIAWAASDGEFIDVDCRVFSVVPQSPHHILHHGGRIDFDDVEAFLLDLFEKFEPTVAAYDPRYLERSMELVDVRLNQDATLAVEPQTKGARDAYQAFYTAVIDRKLRHRGDPIIAAHLTNTAVDRDERTREIRRLRKIDARKPIDAIPALALAVWAAGEAKPSESPFALAW